MSDHHASQAGLSLVTLVKVEEFYPYYPFYCPQYRVPAFSAFRPLT